MPRRPASATSASRSLERAEVGVDGAVVGDVVAPVGVGRGHDRVEPDAVDAEPLEVVERVDDPAQVADAVAVGVRERARVDLVEDAVAPPRRGHRAPGLFVVGGQPVLQHGILSHGRAGYERPRRPRRDPRRDPP